MKTGLLLDLFCCAGGMAEGYRRAGFEVVGVDIEEQPRFPFAFVRADALDVLGELVGGGRVRASDGRRYALRDFAGVHASPPCQRWTRLRHLPFLRERCESYPDLVTPLRPLLREAGLPYVIENNMDAPLAGGWLCGVMFGRRFYRHRRFETSFYWLQPSHGIHRAVIGRGGGINYRRERPGTPGWVGAYGHQNVRAEVAAAMDIDWMNRDELAQAMPPVYGEFMGRQMLAAQGEPA